MRIFLHESIQNPPTTTFNMFKLIFNKFKNFEKDYSSKTPLQKWQFIRSINIFILSFVGCGIMDSRFKLNLNSAIPSFLGTNYFGLMFYTLYHYRYEPLKALQSTPLLGLVIPVYIFIYLIVIFHQFIWNKKIFHFL